MVSMHVGLVPTLGIALEIIGHLVVVDLLRVEPVAGLGREREDAGLRLLDIVVVGAPGVGRDERDVESIRLCLHQPVFGLLARF